MSKEGGQRSWRRAKKVDRGRRGEKKSWTEEPIVWRIKTDRTSNLGGRQPFVRTKHLTFVCSI